MINRFEGEPALSGQAATDVDRIYLDARSKEGAILKAAYVKALDAYQVSPGRETKEAMDVAKSALDDFENGQGSKGGNLANVLRMEEYLQERGYSVRKSKLYEDRKAGLFKCEPDGTIARAEADRYAAAELQLANPGAATKKLKKLQSRKLEAEVRKLEHEARLREMKVAEEEGRLVSRAEVDKLMAGAVVYLRTDMINYFRMNAREIVFLAGGTADKVEAVAGRMVELTESWFNRFARQTEFKVRFGGLQGDPATEDKEAGDAELD